MQNLPNPPDTLRSLLKAHIEPLHQELDRSPTLQALTRPDLDAPTYARTLKHFYNAYRHIEPNVAALEKKLECPPILPTYEPRLPCLKREFSLLDDTEPNAITSNAPLPPMPEFRCPLSIYLGSRYVLEGASQGTPYVIRALQNHHPSWQLHPQGYWHTLATQVPAWRSICQLLDTPQNIDTLQNNKPVTLAELKQGATWVFESFIASLTPPIRH